jgi:hypothetical protein
MNPNHSRSGRESNLPGHPPRLVSLKAARARVYGAYVCGYVLTLLGAGLSLGLPLMFFLMSGMRSPLLDGRLDRSAKAAEATIESIRCMEYTHINSQRPWKLVYHWIDSGGEPVEGFGYLLDHNQAGLQPGDVLPIEYLPETPRISRPAGGMASVIPAWLYLMTLGIMIPELIAGIFCAITARRQIAATLPLLRYGTATQAEILNQHVCWWIRINGRHPVDIEYVFTDPQGRSFAGRDRTYDTTWARSREVGDSIAVIFDPDFPDDNVIWPVTAK